MEPPIYRSSMRFIGEIIAISVACIYAYYVFKLKKCEMCKECPTAICRTCPACGENSSRPCYCSENTQLADMLERMYIDPKYPTNPTNPAFSSYGELDITMSTTDLTAADTGDGRLEMLLIAKVLSDNIFEFNVVGVVPSTYGIKLRWGSNDPDQWQKSTQPYDRIGLSYKTDQA